MKKLVKLLCSFILLLSLALGLSSCGSDVSIGKSYIEQEPVLSVVDNDLVVVLRHKQHSDMYDYVQGKTSKVVITIKSLKDGDTDNSVELAPIYVKNDGKTNSEYVTIVNPDTFLEVGYDPDKFNNGYYSDLYAMKFKLDLSKLVELEGLEFLSTDKFVELSVKLYKGYDAATISATYTKYLTRDVVEDVNVFKVIEKTTATFQTTPDTIIIVNVFYGYTFGDLEGYKICDKIKVEGLKKDWYLFGKKEVTDITEYNFVKEDLKKSLYSETAEEYEYYTQFIFKTQKSVDVATGE